METGIFGKSRSEKQKTIMMLGGTRYLLPAIKAAHDLGLYVITVDYNPNNYAHKFSDEYININIIDKEAVLNAAIKNKIDGIMSYATDPGVVTAAYVAERMGLPHAGTYESIRILQDKGKFRQFLKDNGFNTPWFKIIERPYADVDFGDIKYPCITKPVDSAGSKGVSRVDEKTDLLTAIEKAIDNSQIGKAIIEEFIEPIGHPTDSDSFSIDGELVFFSLNDQWFDKNASNPYTPAGFSWPCTMEESVQGELKRELQRLITLLNMKTGIYNVETRVDKEGNAYIMECSPRAGGNRLAEILRLCTGQDIITASVKAAVGLPIHGLEAPLYNNYWCELILHSDTDGKFNRLSINPRMEAHIIEKDLWVERFEMIESFSGANKAIGTLLFEFNNENEYKQLMRNRRKFVNTIITDK